MDVGAFFINNSIIFLCFQDRFSLIIHIGGIQTMKKIPFVTKEQVEEIVKTYPTPSIYMMKRLYVKMHAG